VLPPDEQHTENVCSRKELTSFEQALFKALLRVSCLIFLCFVANLTVTLWVYSEGNVYTSDLVADIVTSVPILMQIRFSVLVAKTDKGLKMGWIQALRLILFFFMTMNVTRLYTKNAITTLNCQLGSDAFDDPDDNQPKALQCKTFISVINLVSIVMYVILTLLCIGIIGRIEFSYNRRYMKKMWVSREEPLLSGGEKAMLDVTRSSSAANDPVENSI
jgi:hypothetical protein